MGTYRGEDDSAGTGKVLKFVEVAGDTMTGDLTVPNLIVEGLVDSRDVYSDGTKLDTIEDNATADMSDVEIKTAYENNVDTNEFSDAEQSKLSGIETGATADQENIVEAYANIAALRVITAAPSITDATVRGYYTDGDSGANPNGYYWHTTSTDTDDGLSTFKATAIATGRWKAKFSGAINAKWAGAKGNNTANDSSAYQAIIDTFPDGDEVVILVSSGTYKLDTTLSYGTRTVTFEILDGAEFTGTAGIGLNDGSAFSKSARRFISKQNSNESDFGTYIDMRAPSTSGTAAYEKDALLVIAQTDDDSTTYDRDVVGIGARGYISSSNTKGRAWGLNAYAKIASGGEGLLHCIECNIENGGAINKIPDTADAKYGVNCTTKTGSNAGTAALKVSKGGGDGWYKGLWAGQSSFVNDSTSRFLELNNLFSVDRDGKVSIGSEVIDGMLHIDTTQSAGCDAVLETDSGDAAWINYKDTGVRNFSFGLDTATGRMRLTNVDGVTVALAATGALEVDSNGSIGINGWSLGGSAGAMFIANATTVPSSNPTGGGLLYVESGALKYRGSSGTITTLGAA